MWVNLGEWRWVDGWRPVCHLLFLFSRLDTLNKMTSIGSSEQGGVACLLSLIAMALSQHCQHFCTEYLASFGCKYLCGRRVIRALSVCALGLILEFLGDTGEAISSGCYSFLIFRFYSSGPEPLREAENESPWKMPRDIIFWHLGNTVKGSSTAETFFSRRDVSHEKLLKKKVLVFWRIGSCGFILPLQDIWEQFTNKADCTRQWSNHRMMEIWRRFSGLRRSTVSCSMGGKMVG